MTCDCGRVEFWQESDKIVVSAQDTTAVVTIVREGDAVKVEHSCQTCETLQIPPRRLSNFGGP